MTGRAFGASRRQGTENLGSAQTRDWSLLQLTWPVRESVDPLARVAAIKETAPTWQRTLQRLIWLEWWKHAFSIGHILWIAAVYVLAFVPFRGTRGAGMFGMVGIAIVPLFMGIWTFQAEGGRRIRFLADHGLSPQVVWLTKQLVWGLLTAALTLPFILAVAQGNAAVIQTSQVTGTSAFHEDVPGASATAFAAILACLGYRREGFAFRIHVSSSPTLPSDVVSAGRTVFWSVGPAKVHHFPPAPTEVQKVRKEPDGTLVPWTEVLPVVNKSAVVFALPLTLELRRQPASVDRRASGFLGN